MIPLLDQVSQTKLAVELVRDCVEGALTIKRKGQVYLPHPSDMDTSSTRATKRYDRYKSGAEFDDFPDLTRRRWLGKMKIDNTKFDLPEKLEYLEIDADGDGTSLKGLIESVANNLIQTKFHILVADYQGLTDLDINNVSIADVENANARANIKQYPRECLASWNWRMIDGAKKLDFIALKETGSEFNQETYSHTTVTSYLILGLDEDGNYYQQKWLEGGEKGEMNYINVNGQPLKEIPIEIVMDEELPAGVIPKQLGMLYPVCLASLARYQTSADYKEAMRSLAPTTYTKGWQAGDLELFKQVNKRDHIETGATAVNNLPNDVEVDVVSASSELQFYENYFAANDDKIKSLGGVSTERQEGQQTATEALMNSADKNAVLETIANNTEESIKRMIAYCGVFEGVYSTDAINDVNDINVIMPRDFSAPKLSNEEIDRLVQLYDRSLLTADKFIETLVAGGWLADDAEELIKDLGESEPPIRPTNSENNQTVDE